MFSVKKLPSTLLSSLILIGILGGCSSGRNQVFNDFSKCNGEVGIGCNSGHNQVFNDMDAIFNKPSYKNATWGLLVVDIDSGKKLIDINPDRQFYVGSVRKMFTLGELLNEVGPEYRYNTPVYSNGQIDSSGILHGDLILVASGDITMGGRTNPDGSIAYTIYDHNESDSLGNAQLTTPNPLAGYTSLAQQVAQSGIRQITGNVVIDDRLFQHFNFRNEFDVSPIFVNDDVADLTINPSTPGNPASVVYRPISSALTIKSSLVTGATGSSNTFALNPNPMSTPSEYIQCIGQPGCTASVTGQLPIDFIAPLTFQFPYVQTFRITQPANYARTVFIEALKAAGVTINADAVATNPVQLLPAKGSYNPSSKIAELRGMPSSENAKLVMKISYNIGADTSLILFGLTHGVDNMSDALKVEKTNLESHFGISQNEYNFVDGSGGGESTATNQAVVQFLISMTKKSAFPFFLDSLPIMGVDGSLGFVTDFQSDPTLVGATGQVHAKPGSYALHTAAGTILKGQAFGGYIFSKSGKRLAYQLVVNNVPVNGNDDLIRTFQDQGKISAMLWRHY